MVYYLGDPCYIIPDEDWAEFGEKLFATKDFEKGGHYNGSIEWKGQKIEIWSCGGDGTWEFTGLNTLNGTQEFGVDAGIFCIIDLEKLPQHQEVGNGGMLFEKEPDLYVEDWVVYINDIPDNSKAECWVCGHFCGSNDVGWTCETGACEGCENCFECECEEE